MTICYFQIHGDFCATASDLLDAWNAVGRRIIRDCDKKFIQDNSVLPW